LIKEKEVVWGPTKEYTFPALYRLKDLKWEKGTGTFEGHEIAIVSENRKTGEIALFLKVSPHPHDMRLHYHTNTSHSIILDGTVTAGDVNGNIVEGKKGDYFRCPAKLPHTGSGSKEGCEIFMWTEPTKKNLKGQYSGVFDTVYLKPKK